jgi:hypothetical protein
MKRLDVRFASFLLFWLVLGIGVCSCQREEQPLKNGKKGTRDISSFVLSQVIKYGGSNAVATERPITGITNYVYSEDKDGIQVMCEGNKVASFHDILQPHFGKPALTTTNAEGLASFSYAIRQTGVAVGCGLDSMGTKQLTHLVIVRSGAVNY